MATIKFVDHDRFAFIVQSQRYFHFPVFSNAILHHAHGSFNDLLAGRMMAVACWRCSMALAISVA
jgi:hypothetical protein